MSTRIVRRITKDRFRSMLKNIRFNPHVLDRLNEAQREVFTEGTLRKILLQNPTVACQQENGRYAAYYRRKKGYIKVILEKRTDSIELITFLKTDSIPELKDTPWKNN